jgi:adenylate kinase family enzyme
MRRVVVVGAGGSGKTTLGRELARRLAVPFADLDELFWLPGWQRAPADLFRTRVESVIARPSWVIAGDYVSSAAPLIWPKVDTLVWLDLPRFITFSRVVRRTVVAAARHRELWPGCVQHWSTALRTGLFRISWNQPAKYRATFPTLIPQRLCADAQYVRLTRQSEVAKWLERAG